MKVKDAKPRNVKNEVLQKFFEEDISSVLFRNMETGKWKAFTVFGFHARNYKVRITAGEWKNIHSGHSTNMSETTLETLIHINMRSGEYQYLYVKASKLDPAITVGQVVLGKVA